MLKKLRAQLPFATNYIGFATRDGCRFLDVELPDRDLKTIEAKSKLISQLLDQMSAPDGSYYLNVYSAGTEQQLTLDEVANHFGANVWVETNNPYWNRSNWEGQLVNATPLTITLLVNNKGRFSKLVIDQADINLIKLSAKVTKEKH